MTGAPRTPRPQSAARQRQVAGVAFDDKLHITCTTAQKVAAQRLANKRSLTVSALIRELLEQAQ